MNNAIKAIAIISGAILLIGLVIMQVLSLVTASNTQKDIQSMDSRIDVIENKITKTTVTPEVTTTPGVSVTATTTPGNAMTSVRLYYKNYKNDPNVINCTSEDYVIRQLPNDSNLVKATIELLVSNQLTAQETASGITSEFQNADYADRKAAFQIVSVNVANQVATVTFNDPKNFTSGGSCRSGILSSGFSNTLKQFDTVNTVQFLPQDLVFQP